MQIHFISKSESQCLFHNHETLRWFEQPPPFGERTECVADTRIVSITTLLQSNIKRVEREETVIVVVGTHVSSEHYVVCDVCISSDVFCRRVVYGMCCWFVVESVLLHNCTHKQVPCLFKKSSVMRQYRASRKSCQDMSHSVCPKNMCCSFISRHRIWSGCA